MEERRNFGKPLLEFVKKKIPGHLHEMGVYSLVAEHVAEESGMALDPVVRERMHEAVAMALSQKIPAFMRKTAMDSEEMQEILGEKFEESMREIVAGKIRVEDLLARRNKLTGDQP